MLNIQETINGRERDLAQKVRDHVEATQLLELVKSMGLEEKVNAVVQRDNLSTHIHNFASGKGFFILIYYANGLREYEGVIAVLEEVFGPCYKTKDYAEQRQREYEFGDRQKLFCQLTINLSVDAQNCTRVQTGTEIKEVPTYRLDCTDPQEQIAEASAGLLE